MLLQFVVLLLTVVTFSAEYLETTVKTQRGETYPIPEVGVGTRFEFSGVYSSNASEKNMALIWLMDDKEDTPLMMQLRFNHFNESLGGKPDYFLVTSCIVTSSNEKLWAGSLSKRYPFPMELEDGLKIDVLLEVTASHYEITINGVKSSQSMINNRETVEYYKSKSLKVHSAVSFTFDSDVRISKPIGKSLVVNL